MSAFDSILARALKEAFLDEHQVEVLTALMKGGERHAAIDALMAMLVVEQREREAELEKLSRAQGAVASLARDLEDLCAMIERAGLEVSLDTVRAWRFDEREAAELWALDAIAGRSSDMPSVLTRLERKDKT